MYSDQVKWTTKTAELNILGLAFCHKMNQSHNLNSLTYSYFESQPGDHTQTEPAFWRNMKGSPIPTLYPNQGDSSK